jgi:hypothetical protein
MENKECRAVETSQLSTSGINHMQVLEELENSNKFHLINCISTKKAQILTHKYNTGEPTSRDKHRALAKAR